MAGSEHSIFGSTAIPRYLQLADLFRQRIEKGLWPVGTTLPSIEQLMAEFAVARVTVRQAVSLLTGEGLLSPQRGRGTFVTGTGAETRRQLRVETTLGDLVDMYKGDKPRHDTLEEGERTPVLAKRDGTAAPRYTFMRRIHSRNDVAYCVISIYIDKRVFQRATSRFRKELALPVLTSLPGLKIASAKQTLTISKADVEIARLLDIPVNTPMADVRRVLCAPDKTVVYVAEVSYRGDYIHLEMDLKP